jgi:hypothetical protein
LMVCMAIPMATIAGAAVLYPKVFALPQYMTEDEAKIFVVPH